MRRARLLCLLLPLLIWGTCNEGQASERRFEGGEPKRRHHYSHEARESIQTGALLLMISAASFAAMRAFDVPVFDPTPVPLHSPALMGSAIIGAATGAGIELLFRGVVEALCEAS